MNDSSLFSSDVDLSRKIYNAALALLGRREHSQKELHTKLTTKFGSHDQFLSADVEAALQRLESEGYLSDTRYAEAWVRSRMNRGFGRERLRMELAEKGVDEAIAEEALDGKVEEWPEVIETVWRKKFKQNPQGYAEKAKHMKFLRYRGFGFSEIEALFERLNREI